MRGDLVHLGRTLRRAPASTAAAVLTLSLTLGAGASIFAVVHAVLLTPPSFRQPDELVILGEVPAGQPEARPRTVAYATFEAWREGAGPLAALEAVDGTNLTLTGQGPAERLSANDVTPAFLDLLGVTPAIGRTFAPDDVGQPIALVSHGFWRARLGADAGVLGREIVLGGQPHRIVGVLPERFVFDLNPAALWRPLPLTPARAASLGYRVSVVGRLASGVSAASLASVLDDVSRTSTPPQRVVATPLSIAISGEARQALRLLAGAAALAALIAFTNFAGLLIVRAIDRRRELAIRSALGARPSEAARQLVLEAHVLVALGAASGILLALWMTPLVARLALQQFGSVAHREVTVGWRVVAMVVAVASTCGWACAWLPARAARRPSLLDVLRRGATPAPREAAWRRVLVTAEVALAFVLLVSLGVLGRRLLHALAIQPGFDPRGVVALQVSVPAAAYDPGRTAVFYAALQHALGDRLGPRSVGIVDEVPLTHDRGRMMVRARPGDLGREAVAREAGPGYFDVMRIPVIAGRGFEPGDDASAPPRAVISAALAERLFPSELPVGRRLWLAASAEPAEIVGVVGDVKHRALHEPSLPTVYRPVLQAASRSNVLVVRAPRPVADVVAAVRAEVGRLDGSLPVYGVRSLEEVVAASPGMPAARVLTATFAGFAALALVLGAIGLFGVVAHDVAARRRELAVRMALGADPARLLGATVAQGAVMVGWGLVLGGALAVWAAQAVDAAGFGRGGLDALGVGVPAMILMLAGVAAVLPAARRASRTDPVIALRSD